MLTLYFDNKVNWKNQFFSITCPCYKTKVWEVFQFFFWWSKSCWLICVWNFLKIGTKLIWKNLIWKKKWFQNTKKKKFLFSFIYLFIYLSIHLFLQGGGGQGGGVGWKEAKGFDNAACWKQLHLLDPSTRYHFPKFKKEH